MQLTLKKICIYGFYPLWILEYFIMMWGINLNKFIGLPLMVLLVLFTISTILKSSRKRTIDGLVRLFLFYNVFTLVFFMFSGVPFVAYINKIKYFIFPILFYWIGSNDENDKDLFFKTFFWSMAFVFIVGLFWYITLPSYYINYVIQEKQNTSYLVGTETLDENNIASYLSLSSFISIYGTSLLCTPTLACAYGFLFKQNQYYKQYVLHIIGFIVLICGILTYQRIALFCSIVTFVFFAIWGAINKNKSLIVSGIILLFVIGTYVLYNFTDRLDTINELFNDLLDSFSFRKAMEGGRTSQYLSVFAEWDNPLFGSGLGSAGYEARVIGKAGVTDGEYIRILVETGLIGFLLFCAILLNSIIKIKNNFREFLIEAVIIASFILACVGANALSNSGIIPPIFWYCVGRLNNERIPNRYI